MSGAIVQRFYMCRDKTQSWSLDFSVVSQKIFVFAPVQKNQKTRKYQSRKQQINVGLSNKEQIFKKMHGRIKMVK